ncbi:MAG TPA: hypothetical protein VN817_05255 [Solirubrobacteraceae bacterium]|nr:hypothetical protein [Solirubrobacteraceae bacterium]
MLDYSQSSPAERVFDRPYRTHTKTVRCKRHALHCLRIADAEHDAA